MHSFAVFLLVVASLAASSFAFPQAEKTSSAAVCPEAAAALEALQNISDEALQDFVDLFSKVTRAGSTQDPEVDTVDNCAASEACHHRASIIEEIFVQKRKSCETATASGRPQGMLKLGDILEETGPTGLEGEVKEDEISGLSETDLKALMAFVNFLYEKDAVIDERLRFSVVNPTADDVKRMTVIEELLRIQRLSMHCVTGTDVTTAGFVRASSGELVKIVELPKGSMRRRNKIKKNAVGNTEVPTESGDATVDPKSTT